MAVGEDRSALAGLGKTPAVAVRNAPQPRPTSGPTTPPAYSREYSLFVRYSKVGLVLVALILVAAVVAWPNLRGVGDRFQLRAAFISGFENEQPNMHNARYFGVDKSNQPYSVSADLARNLMDGMAKVELERPQADIALEDGTWLVLTANAGVYDGAAKQLDLVGKVNLFHDSGYEFRTAKAVVDLASGAASGHDPVVGQGPFGDLKAQGFRLVDKGRTVFFDGPAVLMMYPAKKEDGQ